MTKKLLDFKENSVQTLTLDELKETIDERNIGGNPISGITHHVLFQRLYDMLEHAHMPFEMDPIYATAGGASAFPGVTTITALEAEHGKGSLQTHLLRRMITSFNIKQGETDETTQSIAIAYHQQGIQAAFGPNVKICKNQCIYGASNRHQTYGDNKVNVETLFQVISDWILNYDQIRTRDLTILEGMKNVVLNYNSVCDIVGELNLKRVLKDSLHVTSEYILQQNQISDLAIKYLEFLKIDNTLDYSKGITLFEFYNLCTEMYKPQFTDLPNIIGRNHLLGDYFVDKFELSNIE